MTSALNSVVLASSVSFCKGWDLWGNYTTVDLIASPVRTLIVSDVEGNDA